MTEWTSEARKERDQFLARQREAFTGTDINADEVIDDMRRHIDEELKTLSIITRDDVVRTIRNLSPGDEATPARPAKPKELAEEKKVPGAALIILGVVLPVIALLFELTSHACAGAFFDPIPTWWHVIMVASVPLLNALIIHRLRSGRPTNSPLLLGANAATIGFSLFYAIAFAPLCVPGVVAVFYFGFGLLPMTPLFATIAAFRCRAYLLAGTPMPPRLQLRASLAGVFTAIAILTVFEFGNAVTRIALEWADDEDPAIQQRGIRVLRWAGNEETMLRACYERPRQFTNLAALAISRDNTVNQSEARTIFFRVTGKPFNAERPPRLYNRNGRWDVFDDMTWEFDEGQGGTSVAGRVRGLYLAGSRMDCRVHSQAGLAYLEWTFEFVNQSRRQREARTQIMLPPNAVVSRLTLWVEGEEREAAFAGRADVREAYENIVRQRRDPVLVTTTGPDRILMQCFPVPPDGGTMKTRIGITTPLSMLDPVNGRLQLPRMIERNFNLTHGLEHAVWIESRSELASSLTALSAGSKDEDSTLHGQIIDSELLSHDASIQITRPEAPAKVWAPDLSSAHVIIQTLTNDTPLAPDRLVIVTDGSEGMAPYYDQIAQALESLPENVELIFLHASDMQNEIEPRNASATPISIQAARTRLASLPSGGGQNNLKWLVRAWDIAASGTRSAVVWIHGPQPVALSSDQALRQRMERSPHHPKLFEIQTSPGANRLLEVIGSEHIQRLPRFGSLDEDLERWFESFGQEDGAWVFAREQQTVSEQEQLEEVPKVTDHIRRLWAAERVESLADNRDHDAAAQLAQHHQLVTSVSGAVVLETQEQFDNAGLTPVDVSSVPIIPEPQTWLLLLMGLGCLAFRKRVSRK